MTDEEKRAEILDLLAAYSDRYMRWLGGYENYGYSPADDRRSVAAVILNMWKELR